MSKIKAFFSKLIAKGKKVDIFKNRTYFFIVPLAIILIALICGTCYQLTNTKFDKFANIGVDFQGGTMLTAKFSEAGMNAGEKYNENLAIIDGVLAQNGFSRSIAQASGESSIVVRYLNTATVNNEIIDYSKDGRLVEMENLNKKMIAEISEAVEAKYNGAVTVEGTTTLIGNSAAMKLLRTALISVSIALALMLIYILIRFDPYSALAAIVALLHDVVIMMAFTVIFYVEIGSSLIAGIITIVAYSINNTIVVFDRVRDLIKPYGKKGNMLGQKYEIGDIISKAIWGTLTRTLYTTLTTFVVIFLLAVIGVASIQTFALPIMFGLIAGFYSSAFLAAPLWGVFKGWGDKLKLRRQNAKFKKKTVQQA